MPQQLHFELPANDAMGEGDYFVSAANAQAHDMVMGGGWPEGKLVLTGPAGSGKSHLAAIWAARTGADRHAARMLGPQTEMPLDGTAVVVEDCEALSAEGEVALFHIHNRLVASGGQLLITARIAPARLAIALPDLMSRLQAATTVVIGDPDDDLLRAVLTKKFIDRQLSPDPKLIDWLLPRMTRSFDAAAEIVAELDRRALAERRVINRSLAREILSNDMD